MLKFFFPLALSILVGIPQADYPPTISRHQSRPTLITSAANSEWVFQDGNIVFPKGKKILRDVRGNGNESAPIDQISIDDKAYFLNPERWEVDTIFVCWENPSAQNDAERQLIRESISETWQKHSKLQFKGWGACSQMSDGIRIRIEDSGPHTKGLGKLLSGKENGMVLNFTYDNWSPACKNMKLACDSSIAVHEFGHALGFAHEQNRPDTPGECTQRPQGTNGDTMLTSWDPESVMNYCNPVYNNAGKLSIKDIAALQYVYGKPAS